MIIEPSTPGERPLVRSSAAWVPFRKALWIIAGVGALLALGAELLANWTQGVLPLAVTVRSAGTPYPALGEALPFMLRGLGVSIVTAAGVMGLDVPFRLEIRKFSSRRAEFLLLCLLLLAALALYTWMAYPHNAFPSNARIHWVDIFFERRRNYFYALVKLPHMLFYDHPHWLQGLNGAVNVGLIYVIGRHIIRSRMLAAVIAVSYLGAGQMLLFANGAEDVQLGVTTLLLAHLAYLRQAPALLGAAIFVSTLARPQFVFLVPAFIAAEAIRVRSEEAERGPWWKRRFLWGTLLAFSVLFGLWHALLAARDVNWLLSSSGLVQSPLLRLTPREIDSFVVHRFSGAYLGHFLWLTPIPLLLANAWALRSARRLPPEICGFLLFAVGFATLNIAFLEYHQLLYYNVRYLSYSLPLLLVTAWVPFHLLRARSFAWRTVAGGAAVVLALAPWTQFQEGFRVRSAVADHPIASLYGDRQRVRAAAGSQRVVTTIESHTHRNYLAYIFRRPQDAIGVVEQGERLAGALVVTRSDAGYEDLATIYDNGAIIIFDAASGGQG